MRGMVLGTTSGTDRVRAREREAAMSDPTKSERIHLVLADGTVFPGEPYGARGDDHRRGGLHDDDRVPGGAHGPVVQGQIVTMTAPEIGNVGSTRWTRSRSTASRTSRASCSATRRRSPELALGADARCVPRGEWRGRDPGVDTRKLTRHLRDHGSQNCAVGPEPVETLLKKAREAPDMSGSDLVKLVTPKERYSFADGRGAWSVDGKKYDRTFNVVAIDYGVKKNILRCLVDTGMKVTVVPASTSAQDILALNPDGVFLSNGPGDPAAVAYTRSRR